MVIKQIVLLFVLATALSASPASSAREWPRARIVFDVQSDGETQIRDGIYSIRPDGSSLTRLAGGTVSWPAWSPGHDWIAYTRWTQDGSYLHVMTDEGGGDRVIARLADRGSYPYGSYSWSPDGSLLAFQGPAGDGVTTDIFVASPDGSAIRDVTARAGSEHQPAWSPDGERIAFVGTDVSDLQTTGSANGIFSIDVDGSDLRQITAGEGDFEPVWSPNGAKIAFSSSCRDVCPSDPQSDGPYSTDLFVANADGRGEVLQLTEDCHWESDLFWLPDSAGILYSAADDDDGCADPKDAEIRVVSLTREQTNLTHNERGDFSPAISPNGRWITFHSYGTTKRFYDAEIFIQRLSDGKRFRVTGNGRSIDDTAPSW